MEIVFGDAGKTRDFHKEMSNTKKKNEWRTGMEQIQCLRKTMANHNINFLCEVLHG